MLRRLFGLSVSSHQEKAEKYEQIGKLGMARLELEQALENVDLANASLREKLLAALDRIQAKEKEDSETRAKEALSRGDQKGARYHLNVALSTLTEDDPAYDRLLEQLNSIPPDSEEAAVVDELDSTLRAEVGVDFLDRQRYLEFWKSGYPPYREDYYFNKALTSEVFRAQVEQVARNPEDADSHFNFGTTLAQLGFIDKALEEIRRFVKLRPDDRDGHYLLANLLADQGRDHEAVREFERTISLDPEFLQGYYYLAVLYSDLQDWERAEKLFAYVAEQGKGTELAEESRSRLEAIIHRK
ncbi:MAG TPA: tetratricopeptide repeat protein [Terriglobia bacterium]|nr:tetratricopeptide repeat protein [Terriglobia bacterium]